MKPGLYVDDWDDLVIVISDEEIWFFNADLSRVNPEVGQWKRAVIPSYWTDITLIEEWVA